MMKTGVFWLGVALLNLAGLTRASGADVPASPLAPIAFLAGNLWRAELPPAPDGSKVSIELRVDWTGNHQALRFESAWVREGKASPYTSGVYGWNAAKKQLVIWYSAAEGSLTEGTITMDGAALVHELTVTDKEGKLTQVRARLTPNGGGTGYTNEISLLKNGAWEKFVALNYERVRTESAAPGK